MARKAKESGSRASTGRADDWYSRWISAIADDAASHMEGEPEREARISDLHERLDHMRRRLAQLGARQRGRGPRGHARAHQHRNEDERIRDDVNDRLTHDLYVDATDIQVAVQDGEVTLTGTVGSRAAKRLAEDCADAIPGVRDVHNSLRIWQPAGKQDDTRGGPDLISRRTAI
ncbi:MAG: BON domain-containing protein [Dongiaceae bacterium]